MNHDLSGRRFGKVLVLHNTGKRTNDHHTIWKCICDCGNYVELNTQQLHRRKCPSCGCNSAQIRSESSSKHHGYGTRLYRIYYGIKTRIYNTKSENYRLYGKRGIAICKEWDESFELFRDWSIDNGYRDDLSIDRIDVNKGYSPENCRWATSKEQGHNRRTNNYITYNGLTKTITDWSRTVGLSVAAIRNRINAGYSVGEALYSGYRTCPIKAKTLESLGENPGVGGEKT